MTTFTGRTKSSTTSLHPRYKAGSGWDYDDTNITYDGVVDPVSGLPVYYDSLGTQPTFSGRVKSTTITATARSKT